MLDFFNNFLGIITNIFNRLMNYQYEGVYVFAAFAAFGIIVFAFEWIMDIIEGG